MNAARWAAAAAVLLCYVLLCAAVVWRQRRLRLQAADAAAALAGGGGAGEALLLVAHASQTGQAEELAWQTAQALHVAGLPVQLRALGEVDAETLRGVRRALFITSTYGEGDPPDAAAAFARRCMAAEQPPDLAGLHVGVLALGDRSYTHFCGFGRALDGWLQQRGAAPMFERIDVDKGDAEALAEWRRRLSHLAGTHDLPDWEGPVFERWRLVLRRQLNPGSAGAPCFHVELEPADGRPRHWEAGDLAQLRLPADPGRARDYSIASLPQDGLLHLLVRQQRRDDGTPGLASGWLTEGAPVGAEVDLRLRAHTAFRIGGNAGRPLLLIGNGTGMAGLRGHLRARARQAAAGAAVAPAWLVFGERHAAHDAYYLDEIVHWQALGLLTQLDLVYSRQTPERPYVQHRLCEQVDVLRRWVADGAAIYVCGSLQGMASAVDEALRELLGDRRVQELAEQGRYRRDVY